MRHLRVLITALTLCLLVAPTAKADRRVTTPREQFGFNLGDDYFLANYKQLTEYWTKLDRESDRIKVVPIGKTEEGRTMLMAIITSPANHKNLKKYQEIARRLAQAEDVKSEEEARRLAKEGKAVVWIDGGLHASEVLGAQQLMETVYQLVSANDAETKRILDDTIVLAVLANPDGQDLCADWYMRNPDPKGRSLAGLPRLYQKYIGHDNNRDFYASTQSETEAMNRIMYREWFPQIVYNHHQTGPAGTVLFMPPFRDPFNFNFDPMIPAGIDLVAAAMENRFLVEDKPGFTTRSGSSYSTWWNGGLRTTCYFHNMIGLLTESIGNPTPTQVPFVARQQLPRQDLLAPVKPQTWHFRQSVDYSVTANRAVLDVASRYKNDFLFNIYKMGRNSIERGSHDNWTVSPKRLTGARSLASIQTPEFRDARGYILSADQPDFPTAAKFMQALTETGITVHRATADFSVAGKSYPAGSFVVKCAQAFRPHILDMFEPQDHPDDFAYPGGPPIPPYDSAGWTLAYQMGVRFDRILEDFTGPFEKVSLPVHPPAGRATIVPNAAGYLLSHEQNDTFIATNRLLAKGEKVYWLREPLQSGGRTIPAGAIYVPATPGSADIVTTAAKELGISAESVSTAPTGPAFELKAPRIALWDRYGGSMESGWTRWLLEQFEFKFDIVFPPTLDAGSLKDKYDALILPDGAIGAAGARVGGEGGELLEAALQDPNEATGGARRQGTQDIPEEYRNRQGSITATRTVPQLRSFLEAGGAIAAVGSATRLGEMLGLPVGNHLTETGPNGTAVRLSREKFYVPGSLLAARVDNTNPLAYGMGDRVDMMFENSPVLKLLPGAEAKGVKRVAWFDSAEPLRSGWAWGQKYLQGGTAAAEAAVGQGKLFLYGPEVTFRAQPHGTFKLLFNGLFYGAATPVTLK